MTILHFECSKMKHEPLIKVVIAHFRYRGILKKFQYRAVVLAFLTWGTDQRYFFSLNPFKLITEVILRNVIYYANFAISVLDGCNKLSIQLWKQKTITIAHLLSPLIQVSCRSELHYNDLAFQWLLSSCSNRFAKLCFHYYDGRSLN